MKKEKLKDNILVEAKDIGMQFKIPEFKMDTLKERFVSIFKKNKSKNKKI